MQAAASASPLIFRRRLGYVRWISISRDPRGAQDFGWVALPCARNSLARNSIAPTRPRFDFIYTEMAARRRFDFIYTEMAARRRFEFYLHRDWCAVEIWFWLICIYTEMAALRKIEFYLHRECCVVGIWDWDREKDAGWRRLHCILSGVVVSCVGTWKSRPQQVVVKNVLKMMFKS